MSRFWVQTILVFAVTVLVLYGLSKVTYRERLVNSVLGRMDAGHELLLWIGVSLVALLTLFQGHGSILQEYGNNIFLLCLNIFLFWIKFAKRGARPPIWLRVSSSLMLGFTLTVFLFYALRLLTIDSW